VLLSQLSQIPDRHIEIGIKVHLRRTAHPKPFYEQFNINNLYKSSAHKAKIVKVEEYRLLFIDWVSKFDKWDYVIDRWGLFNPPGVGPFDHDPDDDIPFNGDDELF